MSHIYGASCLLGDGKKEWQRGTALHETDTNVSVALDETGVLQVLQCVAV